MLTETPYKQVDSCTETVYIKGLCERLTLPSGDVDYKYYAGNVVITDGSKSGKSRLLYLHKDHLGSTSTIPDSQGRVVQHITYDAWGKPNRFFSSTTRHFMR